LYQQRLKALTDQLTQEHEKALLSLRAEFENKNDVLQSKIKEMEISEKNHNQSIQLLEEKLRSQVNEITQMYNVSPFFFLS
jgi:F0F1-type ATP synthase membrane subunit b/b'